MKKGVAPQIYFVMTLVFIVLILGTLFFDIFSPTKKADIDITKNTYLLVNAIKTAKTYVESSLDFSVYQAVYNNSMHGGYYTLSPPVKTMTNELLPFCEEYLEKHAGCVQPLVKDMDLKIHTGLKKGDYNNYPAGLLQCVLSRLRREDNGEVYYGLMRGDLKQLDCDFGNVTEKGLKGFQKDHGLTETGELDDDTFEKLQEVFVSKWGNCSQFFYGCDSPVKIMVLWEDAGVPDEQKVLKELKKAIENKMEAYTSKDYSFMDEYVNLPVYGDKDMIIEKKDYGFLNITLKSNDSVSVTKEDRKQMERINLRMSSEISKEYPIRYMDLYEIAKQTFNEMKVPNAYNCTEYIPGDKLKHKESLSGFVINAEVWEKDDIPCKLTVLVSIEDSTRTFPVFNGTDISFETISFEYLVEIA